MSMRYSDAGKTPMNPGETLSHYRIVALVGAGGMGEVYKAEDTRLKRPVALKLLTPALSDNPDAKRRLMAEAAGGVRARPSEHLHHSRDRRNA